MSVINEIASIHDVIKAHFPDSAIKRQDVPANPTANTFIIRLQYDASSAETRGLTLSNREFQIIYFGTSGVDTLKKFEELQKVLMGGNMMIPIKGSLRYLRVKAFSYGTPSKTAGGVDLVIGVIQTETRTARDRPTYEKIGQVNTEITTGTIVIDVKTNCHKE